MVVTRRLLMGVALTLPLLPGMARGQRGNPVQAFDGQSIDTMIAEFMAAHDVPGMALAIVQAPYIPRVSGHGLADKQTALLVATNTVFDIGEMAEAYTAVAVMQLVEAGRIGLDDPIGKHLAEGLPPAWAAVSVRQLLAHTSGLPERETDPPAFAPGTDAAWSGSDYRLLRALVSTVAGAPHDDFVRRNQFERLGLRHTFFAGDPIHNEAVAQNGNRHAGFLLDPLLINPTEPATGHAAADGAPLPPAQSGAILASASDVSLWDVGLAGGILIKDPKLRAVLYQPHVLADGRRVPVMGPWRYPGRPGLMYVTGGGNGTSAFLSRFTDKTELVCVTLLANKAGLDLTGLARQIAGAYDPRLAPPTRPGLALRQSPYAPAETLDRLAAILVADGIATERTDPATLRLKLETPAPISATAWQDEQEQTWLGYPDSADALHGPTLLAVSPY